MASVYKRTWSGADGRKSVRWVAAYTDQHFLIHNLKQSFWKNSTYNSCETLIATHRNRTTEMARFVPVLLSAILPARAVPFRGRRLWASCGSTFRVWNRRN